MSPFHVKVNGRIIGFMQREKPGSPGEEELCFLQPEKNRSGGIHAGMSQEDQTRRTETAVEEAKIAAYAEGYTDGQNQAREEHKIDSERLAKEFTALVESLKEQYDHNLDQLHEPLLELAIALAKKILGRELKHSEDSREVLLRRVRRMLAIAGDKRRQVIRVHPVHVDWLARQEDIEKANQSGEAKISFTPDETLQRGECVLETDDFIIEGLISRYLEEFSYEVANGTITAGANSELDA